MIPDIAPGQRWEIALNADGHWRPVEIVTVLRDEVQVRYLDMGSAPDKMRVKALSRRQMLENKTRYRPQGTV